MVGEPSRSTIGKTSLILHLAGAVLAAMLMLSAGTAWTDFEAGGRRLPARGLRDRLFIVMTRTNVLADADVVKDFGVGRDRLLITDTAQVWYEHIDLNNDGVDDSTVVYERADKSLIYAVLEGYDDHLNRGDFYGSEITTITELV